METYRVIKITTGSVVEYEPQEQRSFLWIKWWECFLDDFVVAGHFVSSTNVRFNTLEEALKYIHGEQRTEVVVSYEVEEATYTQKQVDCIVRCAKQEQMDQLNETIKDWIGEDMPHNKIITNICETLMHHKITKLGEGYLDEALFDAEQEDPESDEFYRDSWEECVSIYPFFNKEISDSENRLMEWEFSSAKRCIELHDFQGYDKDGIVAKILMDSYGIKRGSNGEFQVKQKYKDDVTSSS